MDGSVTKPLLSSANAGCGDDESRPVERGLPNDRPCVMPVGAASSAGSFGHASSHVMLSLRFRGQIDFVALSAALDRLLAKSASLRAGFSDNTCASLSVMSGHDCRFELGEL